MKVTANAAGSYKAVKISYNGKPIKSPKPREYRFNRFDKANKGNPIYHSGTVGIGPAGGPPQFRVHEFVMVDGGKLKIRGLFSNWKSATVWQRK